MLTSLAIRDIVLIDQLDLELAPGLCVLTGETGAGKSILLDALGLALGSRAERHLVRRGARQGSVSAAFALADGDPAHALLTEHGVEAEDFLVVRRVLGADGRSRAFVNDQPVGAGLLRQLGDLLVEVHGQHEQQSLLDGAVQRRLLDAFGQHGTLLDALRRAWTAWREADRRHAEMLAEVERASREESWLRHACGELEQLAPEPGEEEALADTRARMMNREKLLQAIQDALNLLRGQGAVDARLGSAQRTVERASASAAGLLEPAVAALDRALVECDEAASALERAGQELELESGRLEQVEERLFALRAAARKHQVTVDGLPALRDELAARLAGIDAGAGQLTRAAEQTAAARAAFAKEAQRLSRARESAALALGRAVMAELPPLKLDKARFAVSLAALPQSEWSGEGAERVAFEVATNPGEASMPLAKVASGGELARLMLALKVVLAKIGSTPCIVFDEVDSGIGGAVADAVGERLARLGEALQVLAVTHSPQVAARADQHFRVQKALGGRRATVTVERLPAAARREEIARLLAGATVTEAARAAADSLIGGSA
jgi:DNA repair protein RecN (Recombination protein N)